MDIFKKRKTKYNTIKLKFEAQKNELLNAYRKIDEKDQLIIDLFYLRNDLNNKIKELLEENESLRRKKNKWQITCGTMT